MATDVKHILTINSGSSSLKIAVFDSGSDSRQRWSGIVERIGATDSDMRVFDADGKLIKSQQAHVADQDAATELLLAALGEQFSDAAIDAIGHRLVHGGKAFRQPQPIDNTVLSALRQLIPLAPNHLPAELDAIALLGQRFPLIPQVACFDTAFHRTLPAVAQLFGLPRLYYDEGVQRYGFHGLSYEYVLQELARVAGDATARGRLILAHLGNGASMAAVRDGQSVDTTMGLTPLGGLVMGTRAGDLDPGVMLYLLQQQGISPQQLEVAVSKQGGMLGVSARSSDMRELLAAEAIDQRAAQAVALFIHSARKSIGALAATLGGLDTLVFTGGIGENAAEIRRRICERLDFIGVAVDAARNAVHAPIISPDGGKVAVRVIKTNEDAMIARHTYDLLWERK